MTQTLIATTEPDAEFDLDIRVVTDAVAEEYLRCGTSDGCAPTCASACTSRV
jgi:FxLD family lantipeptide